MYNLRVFLSIIMSANVVCSSFSFAQLPTQMHSSDTQSEVLDTIQGDNQASPDHDTHNKTSKESTNPSQKTSDTVATCQQNSTSTASTASKNNRISKANTTLRQKLTTQQKRIFLKIALAAIGLAGIVWITIGDNIFYYFLGSTSKPVNSVGSQDDPASRSLGAEPIPAPERSQELEEQRNIASLALYLTTCDTEFNVSDLESLIKQGANVNFRYCMGNTERDSILMNVVSTGNLPVARALLERKADINATNGKKQTALHYAVAQNHTEMIQELINAGADVNAQLLEGVTALHMATLTQAHDIMHLLLAGKADPDIINDNHSTALSLAINSGNIPTIELLLNHKASVNSANNAGKTPLMLASENGDEEIVELLILHQADVNSADNDEGGTALHRAVSIQHVSLVQKLLEYNANVNAAAKNGYTSLSSAVATGPLELLELLLSYKADPNIISEEGGTALIIAAMTRDLETVEMLLAHNADPNLPSAEGALRPLHAALAVLDEQSENVNYYAVTEALLNARANVHAKNAEMKNVALLHLAASTGCRDTVQLLLNHEADPNAKDKDGYKPWCYAGTEEIRQLIGAPQGGIDALDDEEFDSEEESDSEEEAL